MPEQERGSAVTDILGLKGLEHDEMHIMGIQHDFKSFPVAILEHIISITRLTYRVSFEKIEGYSSDAGWGCMVRTAQMALCHALSRVCLGEGWRISDRTDYSEYRKILRLFGDNPSSPLSIQSVATMGKDLDISVGQWFGPTSISHVMRRLLTQEALPIRPYVAVDGMISAPDVFQASQLWSNPVLILVPLRLGLDAIQPDLAVQAAATLKWPQSVGILGGKPRSSYFFIGLSGDTLLYLDPHYTQVTVNMDDRDFPLDSFHSHQVYRMRVCEMDPSLALVFLCITERDFLDLQCRALETFDEENPPFVISQAKGLDFNAPPRDVSATERSERDGEDWNLL
jgi:cysteine protease ATG4